MSKQIDSPLTMTTGEAIEAFRRVKISGATVVYADAGEAGIGIAQAYAASGAAVCIREHHHGGTFKGVAAGTFAVGATLYGAADGTLDDTVVGSPIGYALEAATAAGDIIEYVGCKGETDSSALANSGVSERSRAAAAMPTEDIWKHFNLTGMRSHPFSGSLLETDFTRDERANDEFDDTADSTIALQAGTAGIGELLLKVTTDNKAAEVQWNVPIVVSGGVPWAFEARLKVQNITDARATVFAGLFFPATLTGDVIADDGAALTDGDALGFCRFAADGDIIDFIYDEGGQVTNVHDDDYVTLVADTYVTLGMYFNGTTIQGYVNGVATGTAISAADIAAADFPTAAIMVPTLAAKGDAADDFSFTIDWIRVAQLAA